MCSLIKRFFREIKTPIFNNNQQQLLNFAEIKEGGVLVQSLLAFVETLPVSYRSTLGFLMRQLKKVLITYIICVQEIAFVSATVVNSLGHKFNSL